MVWILRCWFLFIFLSLRKMELFHKDILRFGSIVGLRYFQFYLRGREELITTINLPTSSDSPIKECFLITLYYKKEVPIVYALRDATLESGKTAEEQREVQIPSIQNWKKKQVRLRTVLEQLLQICAIANNISIEVWLTLFYQQFTFNNSFS